MRNIKDFFAHPIIQTALVTGAAIVVLAWFSKRVLAEPLREWELALPGLLFGVLQGLAARKAATPWLRRPWIGMLVIVAVTVLVIVLNA